MNDKVEYGKLPGKVKEGWDGICFWYITRLDSPNAEEHENLVKPIIDKQMHDSYDHGQEWRVEKIEAVVWERYYQVTLCSFYIRDSY